MPLILRNILLLCFLLVALSMHSAAQITHTHSRAVKINWVDKLPGDYSFSKKWSYAPGISLTVDGRVKCDGFCPPQTEKMLDSNGNILPDSAMAYYKLVDTTHLYHTMICEAHCYEWAGTDYITANRRHDTIAADTYCNPATHSSLRLRIVGDKCYATIIVNSIRSTRAKSPQRYYCKEGTISIDRKLLERGILKAEFDFSFYAPRAFGDMYWRGRIYKTIEPPQQYEGMWLN